MIELAVESHWHLYIYFQSTLAATVTKYEASEKSRDQLNSDYTKAMLSKAQLESLCRELQKQNKLTKV